MLDASSAERSGWMCLSATSRQHGGNDGYDDLPDSYYTWDSTVPNDATIQEGDVIVLWDKLTLLGMSVIERISKEEVTKLRYRCPHCERTDLDRRQDGTYRCHAQNCRAEFQEPIREWKEVTRYKSDHAAGWVSLEGRMSAAELRSFAVQPSSQHSLRRLRLDDFLRRIGDAPGLPRFAQRVSHHADGHGLATVRVRKGQAHFRQRLLEKIGPICAFTGPTHEATLEAGHLYSYAEHGKHHEGGGLLLRRDVHRLFDLGLLAVNPMTMRIDLSPSLLGVPAYASLNDAPVCVPLGAAEKKWLEKHWNLYRSAPGS